MLRWGLVEIGGAGDAPVYAALREAGHDLAVVGSRTLTAAQAFAAGHGVRRARGSYEDVLAADDVDAVYLALPGFLREQWATAAVEAGKHVLCRRPVATDASGVGRAAAAATKAGRVLAEVATLRHHPAWLALVEAVTAGALGEIRGVQVACHRALDASEGDRLRAELGGGVLLEAGTDAVAAARWLLGAEPTSVAAVQRRPPGGADVGTASLLGFPEGQAAVIEVSYDSPAADRIEVTGSSGRAVLHGALVPWRADGARLELPGREPRTFTADPHRALVEAFTAATATSAPSVGAQDAVATAGIVDRIRLASG